MTKRILYFVLAFIGCNYVYFFWLPPVLGFGGMHVVSDSMAPGLLIGDSVFVYKAEPELGDVVVLIGSRDKPFVKRLVAKSGDAICFNKEDFIRKNNPERKYIGEFENSSLTNYKTYQELAGKHFYNTIYPPQIEPNKDCLKVPQNELFFVGDNRTRSLDSRYSSFPRKFQNQSYYKVSFVFYSKDLSRLFKWVD